MKNYVFLIIILLSCTGITPNEQQYDLLAEKWIKAEAYSATGELILNPYDLHLLLNIIYFSYQRSQATITVQPLALRALNGIWKGWHNILATRLDTSTELPHAICTKKEKNFELIFWESYLAYRTLSKTYHHAITLGVQGDLFAHLSAQKAMIALREEARHLITQTLMNIKHHIYTLWCAAHKQDISKGALQNLIDFISSYMPPLMQQSFIKANELSIHASQETWEFLQSIQEISNYTWETIEQVRANFYMACYRTVYTLMEQQTLEPAYFTMMFDENGLIPENMREKPLPHP